MSLTARQISLIQTSFSKVEPIAEQAAEIFYSKLFSYDPSLRRLFKGDIKDQGRKLMSVLKTATASLNDLNALVPILQNLARQHVAFGVKVEDYTPVGNALIYTLQQGLGTQFTAELRQAWVSLFKLVADVMRQAAYSNYDSASFQNAKRYKR